MDRSSKLPSEESLARRLQGAERVDPSYWERMAEMGPEEVCVGTGARVAGDGIYAVEFLGRELFCYGKERCIKDSMGNRLDDFHMNLIVLLYLQSKDRAQHGERCLPMGKAISAFQLPNGEIFFKGPHALPTASIEKAFGKDPGSFSRAGKALGGKRLSKGDASFSLRVLPCIEFYFYLYAADDEFPARANILFNDSIASYLPLDGIWVLAKVVVKELLDSDVQKGVESVARKKGGDGAAGNL